MISDRTLGRARLATALAFLGATCCGGAKARTPSDGGADDSATADAGTAAAWPMFQRNVGHAGTTVGALGQTPTLRWTFTAPGSGQSMGAPAVGADGTVYVATASAAGGSSSVLLALHSDGSQAWRATLAAPPADPASTPVIGANGSVYVQIAQSGVIFAFDANGTALWQTPGGSDSEGLTAGADGSLYTGLVNGSLLAVDPTTGATRWQFLAASPIASYAACGPDGTIYVGASTTKQLDAIHPDGTSSWTLPLPDQPTSPPVVGDDGTIYIGSLDGHLLAVDPAGTVDWSVVAPATVTSTAVGPGPTVYVAANDLASTHVVSAVDGSGQILWSTSLPDWAQPPIVTPDGHVILNQMDGGLVVIAPGGAVVDTAPFGASPTSYGLAVSDSGLVLVGSGDGVLYAFGL
jgi:outer membrane protein assembly factor BamB